MIELIAKTVALGIIVGTYYLLKAWFPIDFIYYMLVIIVMQNMDIRIALEKK